MIERLNEYYPHNPGAQLRVYARQHLSADLVAGLTVAVVAIPQSMAFAIIAGLNPIYGLYTSVVTTAVVSALGKSSVLSSGPTNALSLVVASTLAPFAPNGDELARLFTLTLLVGVFQLLMGVLKLGDVSRYVSNAVMVGFITGAGVLIAVGQLGNLLGVTVPRGADAFTTLASVVNSLPDVNVNALGVGLLTAWLVVGLRRTRLKAGASLLAVIIVALGVAALGLRDADVRLVGDIAEIPRALPAFTVFRPLDVSELAPKALALALLGLVQSVSLVQSLAYTRREPVHPSREFIAQGMGNVAGAFFQCMPGGGSLSRTAVNLAAGARTRMAGVFSAAFVAAVLLSFAPLAEHIPLPALAGLLIFTAADLMNWQRVALTWRTAPTSRAVFLVTFVATLIFPLEYSIYLGALLSILNYLQASSHPQITRLVPVDGSFREVPLPSRFPSHHPILISVTGYLHFAAIHDIEEKLNALSDIDEPIIILRLRSTDLLGSTAISFLEALHKLIAEHNGALILCGVEPGVARTLRRSGLLDKLGEQNVFYASDMLLESTRQAFERAQAIQKEMERRHDNRHKDEPTSAALIS